MSTTSLRADSMVVNGVNHHAHRPDAETTLTTRIAGLGVGWVTLPTTRPWGNRSMIFTDPEGNLISVFSAPR